MAIRKSTPRRTVDRPEVTEERVTPKPAVEKADPRIATLKEVRAWISNRYEGTGTMPRLSSLNLWLDAQIGPAKKAAPAENAKAEGDAA